MFDNLPDDIGGQLQQHKKHSGSTFAHSSRKNVLFSIHVTVFATTSANPYEPAYGCCWDQDVHAYVGTAYSVKWMEDSDKVH